jgi:hypothetical protein
MAEQRNLHSRFSTFGATTVPSGSRTTKYIWRIGPFIVSEKHTSQNEADNNSTASAGVASKMIRIAAEYLNGIAILQPDQSRTGCVRLEFVDAHSITETQRLPAWTDRVFRSHILNELPR